MRRFLGTNLEYLIRHWHIRKSSFCINTPEINLCLKGSYDYLIIQICSNVCNDKVLIDAELCKNDNLIKYFTPLESDICFAQNKLVKRSNVYIMPLCETKLYEYQPCGSQNLNNTTLKLTLNCDKGKVYIYARKFNVLRFLHKKCGLAYTYITEHSYNADDLGP